MSRSSPIPVLFVAALAVVFPASCNHREDPGMAEKIALLEAELRSRDEQLAAMEEESKSAADSSAESTSGAPDLEAAKGAYLAFVESLRAKLAGELPGAKFDRTSVFPVEGPDPSKPILSRVAFRITGADGRSGEMLVPLFADPAGDWQEPETTQIVADIKAKLAAPSQPPASAAKPAEPTRSQPTDVMGASRTVEVDWNDGNSQPGRPAAQAPAPPPAPAAPAAPAVPKKVMPTSRDVIIDFD